MAEQPQPRHPRALRLLPVWRQCEEKQQQALTRWGQLQQQLQQEQLQRQQLLEYADDYRQQITRPGPTAIRSAAIHNTLGFLGQVEQAIAGQLEQIRLLEGRVEQARVKYLECRAKTDGLQRLMARLDLEWQQSQLKSEQRQADEWANRAAFQRLQTDQS